MGLLAGLHSLGTSIQQGCMRCCQAAQHVQRQAVMMLCQPLCIQGLWYLLGTKPNPVIGALDFYTLGPINKVLQQRFRSKDFILRDK